ncbi:uncharacterized protein BKA78DRAFT_176887 [Phyllosticta capitalensis]|uniref:uncharacterized protein n=1 Tax=Phyllosticta capitalensis TaxID=121624 RepID=UPI0031319925
MNLLRQQANLSRVSLPCASPGISPPRLPFFVPFSNSHSIPATVDPFLKDVASISFKNLLGVGGVVDRGDNVPHFFHVVKVFVSEITVPSKRAFAQLVSIPASFWLWSLLVLFIDLSGEANEDLSLNSAADLTFFQTFPIAKPTPYPSSPE